MGAWKLSVRRLSDMTCSVLLAVVVVKDFGLQWHRETSRLLRQLFMSLSGPEFMASRMDTLLD